MDLKNSDISVNFFNAFCEEVLKLFNDPKSTYSRSINPIIHNLICYSTIEYSYTSQYQGLNAVNIKTISPKKIYDCLFFLYSQGKIYESILPSKLFYEFSKKVNLRQISSADDNFQKILIFFRNHEKTFNDNIISYIQTNKFDRIKFYGSGHLFMLYLSIFKGYFDTYNSEQVKLLPISDYINNQSQSNTIISQNNTTNNRNINLINFKDVKEIIESNNTSHNEKISCILHHCYEIYYAWHNEDSIYTISLDKFINCSKNLQDFSFFQGRIIIYSEEIKDLVLINFSNPEIQFNKGLTTNNEEILKNANDIYQKSQNENDNYSHIFLTFLCYFEP